MRKKYRVRLRRVIIPGVWEPSIRETTVEALNETMAIAAAVAKFPEWLGLVAKAGMTIKPELLK